MKKFEFDTLIIESVKRLISKYKYFIISILGIVFIFSNLVLYIWKTLDARNERDMARMVYIKDRIAMDKIHTESDRYSKITTFYSEIVSTYFHKYHKKYNKKGKWMYQGLDDHQVSKVINLWYRGNKDLTLNYMFLPAIAVRESSGNPLARTFNKDGTILEAGLYNHRREAAIQAFYYNSLLIPHLQARYAFKFNKMEDLLDPITATKVELNLLWGELMYFNNNATIGITARHWGNYKIDKLVRNGVYPPKDFVFNIGRINEDVRNPFTYYFIINQYVSAFEKFTTKIRLDKRYDKIYRESCSKLEREYINSKKYFQEWTKMYKEEKKDNRETKKRRKIRDKKFEKKVKNMNAYFIETQEIIKSGNFKSLKNILKVVRLDLRKFTQDMDKEKNNKVRRIIKVVLIVICLIIIAVITLLIIFIIKYIKLKRKVN